MQWALEDFFVPNSNTSGFPPPLYNVSLGTPSLLQVLSTPFPPGATLPNTLQSVGQNPYYPENKCSGAFLISVSAQAAPVVEKYVQCINQSSPSWGYPQSAVGMTYSLYPFSIFSRFSRSPLSLFTFSLFFPLISNTFSLLDVGEYTILIMVYPSIVATFDPFPALVAEQPLELLSPTEVLHSYYRTKLKSFIL